MRMDPAPTGDGLRLAVIERARRAVLDDGASAPEAVAPWIERSWRRCLAQGHRPDQRLGFDLVSESTMRRTAEANAALVQAARPQLDRLVRALAQTRYFAILTNAQGVVVDAQGPIDASDRRAQLITRVGVDLSEAAVGTTAIGAALTELQPVWLHRGEHFFADTGMYSCAGAPIFDPDGRVAGMLDLTGIDTRERPELRHMAAQSARGIENALTRQRPHALLLRINWPGHGGADDSDGLIALDADGVVCGLNTAARQMLALPLTRGPLHCGDLFAMPWTRLFDAARRDAEPLEAPLWTGLRLQVSAQAAGSEATGRARHAMPAGAAAPAGPQGSDALPRMPLKDMETTLIRRAVTQARGNVAEAARMLGISRATVYRKLGRGKGG